MRKASKPQAGNEQLADIPDGKWQLAVERQRLLNELTELPNEYGERGEIINAAASELGVHPTTVYRALGKHRDNPSAQAQVPRNAGRKLGYRLIDPKVEAVIEQEVKGYYLKQLKPKKSVLFRTIRALCDEQGLTKPTMGTINRRLANISKREMVKKREGAKRARERFNPIKGSLTADFPFEIVPIDHTPTDVFAIEPETQEVIGRPVITLSTDVRTRIYGGLNLTFDPPSTVSVAACLTHTVMDKGPWLASYDLPDRWPACGKMKLIHMDNAAEFWGKSFLRTCDDHGIKYYHRPPGTPHYGGHVERRIGHLSQEIHTLHGTTFSNIQERGAYDSEGRACLTIEEIRYLIATIILQHNSTFHEGIQTSPLAKWEVDTKDYKPKMPPNMVDFYRDFLPSEERVVDRDGISLFGIHYWHEALTSFLHNQRKVIPHYDPANLSKIFVRSLSGLYIEVPYRDLKRPATSLWEYRAARRALRAEGRRSVDEAMVFDMILRRRRVLEVARKRSRRARLELARGPRANGAMPLISTPKTGNTEVVRAPTDDDAPLQLPYFDTEEWNE